MGGKYSQQSIRDEAQSPTSHGWMCLLMYVCGHYQRDRPGPVTAAVTPHELQIKYSQREKRAPALQSKMPTAYVPFSKMYVSINAQSSHYESLIVGHLHAGIKKKKQLIIALVSCKTPHW